MNFEVAKGKSFRNFEKINMKKITFLCLLLIFNYKANATSIVKNFIVKIEPNIQGKTIKGSTKIIFKKIETNQLVFPIYGINVEKVLALGKPIEFTIANDQLKIKSQLMSQIEIFYSGSPSKGLFWGEDYVYSNFDPCGWMICFEDVSIRAPFEIHLKYPTNLKSIAIGQLISAKESKYFRTEVWKENNAYSSYLYGFAIGNFTRVREKYNQISLEYMAVNDSEKNLKEKFKQTTELAIKYFEKRSGVPFPGKSYTQVLVKNKEAQEKQGFSVIGHGFVDPILTDPQEDWAIVHELAHQWWGNNITCKSWDHFWLNESIVVFITATYKQERWGQAAYDREMDLARKRYQNAKDAKFDVPLTFSGEYPSLIIKRSIVYSKGTLFLDSLRKEMGENAFWSGLKFYTQKNLMRSVVSKDFQAAMELSSKKDLSTIFKKWVY